MTVRNETRWAKAQAGQEQARKDARDLLARWRRRNRALEIAFIRNITISQDERSIRVLSHSGETLGQANLLNDGTITLEGCSTRDPGRTELPLPGNTGDAGNIHIMIQSALAHFITRTITSRILAQLEEPERQRVGNELHRWTTIAAEASVGDSREIEKPALQFAQGLAGMTDPETMEQLRYLVTSEDDIAPLRRSVTLWQYCTARRLGPGLSRMAQSNPGALTWVLRNHPTGPDIRHPGQITAMAREELGRMGLDPKAWRTFAKLPPRVVIALSRTMEQRLAAEIVNIMARAGAVPTPGVAAQGMRLRNEVRLRTNGPAAHPHPAALIENARHALDLMFRESRQHPGDDERIALESQDLIDHLGQVSWEQDSIRSRTWRGLTRRSLRWHQEEIARAEMRVRMEADDQPGWQSLIETTETTETIETTETTETGGITATALRTPLELAVEGARMKNCVAGYEPQCRSGQSRIFSLARGERQIATLEIRMDGDSWRVAQVRGRQNGMASEETKQAASEVARRYTRAWRENQRRVKQNGRSDAGTG